ncbi:predicted protein [Streptomyces sp. AA4]|nr:predicted protein [Streptomyces sp. AA4]
MTVDDSPPRAPWPRGSSASADRPMKAGQVPAVCPKWTPARIREAAFRRSRETNDGDRERAGG